jgi:CLIP-associating protein 1/2
MNLLLEKLGDNHYKVVEKVLHCLQVFIDEFKLQFEPFLERVFSKILLKLTDHKEEIRKLTENTLLIIGNSYTPELLLPVLFKVLDNPNSKIQLACLEYILYIVPNSYSYLSFASHMRTAITKINSLLSNKKSGKSIEAVSIALLLSLYGTHSILFLEQVLLLSINEQLTLKKALESRIPNLESELATVSKQKTTRCNSATIKKPMETKEHRLRSNSEPNREGSSPGNNFGGHTTDCGSATEANNSETSNNSLMMIPSHVLDIVQKRAAANTKTLHRPYNPRLYERKYNDSLQKDLSSSKFTRMNNSAVVEIINMLDQIHYNCTVSRAFGEACKNIRHLTELVGLTGNAEYVKSMFAKLLFTNVELIHNEDAGVRTCSLYMLQALLQNHISMFEDFADITLKKIMAKYTDPVPEVFRAAVEVSETFVSSVDPLRTIEVLRSMIVSNQVGSSDSCNGNTCNTNAGGIGRDPRDAVLLGSIKLMTKLVSSSKISVQTLSKLVPSILPGLTDSMNHPNADIRKAVVYCLVDLYDKLGSSFKETLYMSLTEPQIKLVTVYLKERKNRSITPPEKE